MSKITDAYTEWAEMLHFDKEAVVLVVSVVSAVVATSDVVVIADDSEIRVVTICSVLVVENELDEIPDEAVVCSLVAGSLDTVVVRSDAEVFVHVELVFGAHWLRLKTTRRFVELLFAINLLNFRNLPDVVVGRA